MRLGIKLATGTALSLAMIAGNIAQAGPLASPAAAREHYDQRRGNGINVGTVLLGAAVIGGIAAIASSSNRNRDAYATNGYYNGYDGNYAQSGYNGQYAQNGYGQYGYAQNGYADNGYNQSGYGYDQRAAIDPVALCARAAERAAESRGGNARVTQIYRVDTQRGGARVTGGLALDNRYGYRAGYGDDRQQARFNCTARFGQITQLSLR